MRRTRFALLALLVTQLACNTLFPPRPALTWDTSPTALIVRASSCCGLVPNTFIDNYIPDAQLWGDGRLVWVEYANGGQRRVLTATLTTAEMEAVLRAFVDAGFFGWNGNYGDYSITDLPNTCLQVTLLSTSQQVCEYYQGAPKAFHTLYDQVASGAGQTGAPFVPERGYLTAYPLPADPNQPSPDPSLWQWPAAAAGFSLTEAESGRWIEGPALDAAWEFVGASSWNTRVQDGVNTYEITVIVPGVSWVQPPVSP